MGCRIVNGEPFHFQIKRALCWRALPYYLYCLRPAVAFTFDLEMELTVNLGLLKADD